MQQHQTSPTTATMFLDEFTVVDHAFIDKQGYVVGGSFNPSVLMTGNIDPVEKVVVDFSTVKKRVKQLIDHNDYGFDHKCWIIEGISNVISYRRLSGDELSYDQARDSGFTEILVVTTPYLSVSAPRNSFKFIDRNTGNTPTDQYDDYGIEAAGKWMQDYLNVTFSMESITVECNNTITAHTYLPTQSNPIAYFSYVHGLKDSTSWGCQCIVHGHLSFIQFECDASVDLQMELLTQIASDFDYSIFINDVNVLSTRLNPATTDIGYQSHSRGKFAASFTEGDRHKLRVLPTETTIEFLVDHITSTYRDQLTALGVTKVFVSEGLSKGAVVNI